jgi:anhydro-N-acetylmuramic acid kinase
MKNYKVIGLMSGTSLDGVDLAYCEFSFGRKWNFKIICSETVDYTPEWIARLSALTDSGASTLARTHIEYGRYLGKLATDFIHKYDLSPEFISSHGHTIFHQPEKGFTLQIGDGNSISATTGLPVIFDFRSLDVALGGQGAPLVPIGDRLLFSEYDHCLNLGGIANISYEHAGKRIAFDICPVNMALNFLVSFSGYTYDNNGSMASRGQIDPSLLYNLNQLDFYKIKPPKSLGREWVNHHFLPLMSENSFQIENKLRTVAEHIAAQIAKVVNALPMGKMLVTGGGAKNDFLIGLIKSKINSDLVIPDPEIIDFKEALIFAFLGVLRWRGEINTLSSVTGASKDSCGGILVNG